MTRGPKWLVGLGLFAGLLALLWGVVASLIPSDEELARRTATALESLLGVPVTVGTLHWRLLPLPALVLENVVTAQPQPITLQKLRLEPDLLALWQGRLKIDHAELVGAVVPQLSLGKLGTQAEAQADAPMPGGLLADALPLARFVFRDVRWISRNGIAVSYDGEVDFDPGWRPRQAQLRRPDFKPVMDLTLSRKGQSGQDKEDRWDLRINAGGGTAHGELQLQTSAKGQLQLQGKLQPREIEVAGALAAFNRHSVVAGKVSGSTVLSAQGSNVSELAQSLHSQTAFTMGRATLLRFDLDKTVRSAGKEYAGQTTLDSVTGQLDTQNTAQGMVLSYSKLKASSGALSISGKARLANRQIEAEFAVDLVDGLVGVPLQVSGPLDKVSFSVPRGVLMGAAVGTAVLPGVGTAIGARVGATLGRIFSPQPDRKSSTAPDR
ncbi:AsmA-like C-terminal region [Polaromonas sp. OV174]|uniref:glycine zipper domain-containing protein n=1 Tax=Polaromonas sp. OV174 TaxID=1855300 RepID=UPI0008E80677|nr:AsmA-like C-terminal region-containing protein [Polaromonas sp. OV174]SFB84278.1 AsmA-like C-terminal region [Polaromonas sp. OV174]